MTCELGTVFYSHNMGVHILTFPIYLVCWYVDHVMETITQILGISICWGQPNHHTHNNKLRMGRPTQGLEAYHDIRGTTLGPVRFLCGLSLSVVVPSWLACIHFINNMTLYICRTLYTAQMKYSCTHFIWHDLIRFKGDIPFNSLHHWNAVNTDADVQRCLRLVVAEQHTGILSQCDMSHALNQ